MDYVCSLTGCQRGNPHAAPVSAVPADFACEVPMTRAFIFDMDGTLADSMPFHEQAWTAMMPELGVKVDRDAFFAGRQA